MYVCCGSDKNCRMEFLICHGWVREVEKKNWSEEEFYLQSFYVTRKRVKVGNNELRKRSDCQKCFTRMKIGDRKPQ